MSIDIGDLVKIKKFSIGIPEGTIGLVIGGLVNRVDRDLILYEVQLPEDPARPNAFSVPKAARYFAHDLEVINEAG